MIANLKLANVYLMSFDSLLRIDSEHFFYQVASISILKEFVPGVISCADPFKQLFIGLTLERENSS